MRLDTYELTSTQQGALDLAFSDRAPGPWVVVHRIEGDLDVARLQRAVGSLSSCTTIFGRSFVNGPAGWSMVVGDDAGPSVALMDVADHASVYPLLHDLRHHAFRPESAPLARFHLFRLPDGWLLAFTAASWLIDRFSLARIYEALSAAYAADAPVLESVDLEQAALPTAEREFLASAQAGAAERFWVAQLKERRTRLSLPRWPDGLGETTSRLELPADALAQAAVVADLLHLTPETVLHAALHLHLARMTGSDSVLTAMTRRLGEPLQPGTSSLVGFAEGPTIFMSRPAPELRVRDYLLNTQRLNEYALRHSSLPIGRVIDAVRRVEPGFTAFTNVGVELDTLPYSALSLPGATAVLLPEMSYRTPTTDISFSATAAPDAGIVVRVRDSQVLPALRATIPAMIRRLSTLTADLDTEIAGLSWLDERQRGERIALAGASTPAIPQPAFLDRLVRNARSHPDAEAVRFGTESLTYRELLGAADAVARRLKPALAERREAEPLVAVCLPRSIGMIVAVIGVMRAGAGYVPLDPTNPPDRLAYILSDSRAAAVVVDDETSALVEGAAGPVLVPLPDRAEWAERLADPVLDTPANDGSIAYVIYTSGTTGLPKGVVVERGNLAAYLSSTEQVAACGPGDRWLQFASINFDASVLEIGNALARGACLVVTPSELRSDPEAIVDLLERERITHAFIPPAMLRSLPRRPLPHLSDIYVGGEASDDVTVAYWSRATRLWNVYGPTETTIMCSAKLMSAQRSAADLGGPLPGYTMHVLDASMEPVPAGATGEIWIGGPGVTRGYLDRDELTAQKFVPSPFGPGRLYRSGDLARHYPNGDLEYLGRNDFQVKIRGFRIELGDIEAAIADVRGVTGVHVTVIEGPAGSALGAWYTAAVDGPTADAVAQAIGHRLPHYMVPSHLVRLDEFPVTLNGKIDRARLPMPVEGQAAAGSGPLSPREQAVRDIWADVLGVPAASLGADTHFFQVGGHSLAAAVACHRVDAQLGLVAAPRLLFEHPTLQDFCSAIGAEGGPPRLDPLLPTGVTEAEVPGSLPALMLRRAASNGQDTSYTIVVRVDMGPQVNPVLLRSAARDLLGGDPVFRAGFRERGGRTLIAVDPQAPIDVGLRTGIDVDDLAHELRDTAFDLSTAPLWRAEVVITDHGSSLLLAISHAIFDGWSLNLMLAELAARYDAAGSGEPFSRAAPTMLDYGAWLAAHAPVREKSIDYWSAKLADASCRTELPTATGMTRPDSNRELAISLPPATAVRLKQLASDLDVTLSPVLFAAYLVWLWRITGQRELCVAYPYAGRDVPGTDAVYGMFVQMGFLRVAIDPDESFAALVGRVARQMIDDRDHLIASPYDADISRSGAPNTLFSLQSGIGLEATYGSVSFRAHEYTSRSSKADIAAVLYEGADGGIEGRMEFDASALDAAAIPTLLECLTHLVNGVAGQGHVPVYALPYLPPDQARQLAEFASGGAAPDGPSTLVDAVRATAASHPDEVAIEGIGRQVTYAELDRATDALAAHIRREVGPDAEQPIGLSGTKSPELVMAAVAILKAGCAYVPLDPHYPAERLRYIMEDAGVRSVVADADAAAVLSGTGREGLAFIDPYAPPLATDIEIAGLPDVDPRSLAYVIYTSGSTGRPKGVMIEHGTVPRMIRAAADLIDFGPGDRMLLLGTLNFDASVLQVWTPLLTGGTLVVPAPDAERSPDGLHAFLVERLITHVVATPSLVRNLPREALPSLRFLGFGGEAIDAATAAYWAEQTALFSLYGPTETTVMCTAGRILPGANSRIIGRPIEGYTVSLRDDSLQLVPLGAIGEVVIGGGGAARGYLGRADLTLDRFTVDPDGLDPYEIVYRSGDLGRFLADGTIEYLGRNDDQVKLRGFRIELGEIESALQTAPGVVQAAAMVRGEGDLRMIVGYLEGPADLDVEAVRAHSAVLLPDYMVPSTFVRLDAMPLNANGKLDRRALPDVSFASTSDPPRAGLESDIAAVWEDLLHVAGIGRDDDFFRLGGNSLLAARLQALVRERLGLEVSSAALYARPTIAGMARGDDDSPIGQAMALVDAGIALDAPVAPVVLRPALPAVLLTGATGFLGVYLLAALLRGASTVTCIVRGTTLDEARASLQRHAAEAGIDVDMQRVDVVLGDLAAPGLGLGEQDAARLADGIDVIVHCGAWVHHLYSFATLRSSNVDATVDLVRLALRGARRASMCFVSTESTAEAIVGIDAVVEDVLDPHEHPPASDIGYLLTKWTAEQLVARAVRDHGLDAVIVRPGNITGDSGSGFSNYANNHFWLFTKGCLQLGAVPTLHHELEMTPVDVLAEAIAALAVAGDEGLTVRNLSNPHAISWPDWVGRVADLTGTGLVAEEPDVWQARVAGIDEGNALWAIRSFYATGDIDGEALPTRRDGAQARLAELGQHTASDPQALAAVYVPYLVAEGFLAR